MSDPSDHSAELAAQLRETALKNLGRSGTTYRSAISGRFITNTSAARHPGKTTTEIVGRGGSSTAKSRSSTSGRFLGKNRNG